MYGRYKGDFVQAEEALSIPLMKHKVGSAISQSFQSYSHSHMNVFPELFWNNRHRSSFEVAQFSTIVALGGPMMALDRCVPWFPASVTSCIRWPFSCLSLSPGFLRVLGRR